MHYVYKSSKIEWINLVNPTKTELSLLAEQHGFSTLTIEDSLEPGHLPKFETNETISFLLVRFFQKEDHAMHKSTIREFSHKLSIYFGKDFILTVYQKENSIIEKVNQKYLQQIPENKLTVRGIIHQILDQVIKTYEAPALEMNEKIDELEHLVFNDKYHKIQLPQLYSIKREATACKKILNFTADALQDYSGTYKKTSTLQDVYEENTKMLHFHSQIVDDVQNLLSIYLSLNSQKSNDIMKTLTIFSAFFLPLTFIAGVYGMNFEFMPELAYRWSYPICLLVMLIVVIFIYFWFKKKNFL